MIDIDEYDLKILRELQKDASHSADSLSERVMLSRNACWRRVKRLEEAGYITGRVALLDAERAGISLSVIILLRTSSHDAEWLDKFRRAVLALPEITAAYRMSGDLDYMLRARVADVKAYDELYQRLIRMVPLTDVSASFVMEEIKETTALPLSLATMRREARRRRED